MRDFLFSKFTHFRCERKFYIEGSTNQEIEASLKFHPAIFNEIYHGRYVNNIYFDSFNLRQYFDNINGVSRRLKVRIRWYGELFGFIQKPILELKLKHNLHVGKLFYPLKSFSLDNDFSIDSMREVFRSSAIPEFLMLHLMELNVTLLNHYKRKYFLSADKKYRVTIDADMEAYKLSPYQNSFLHKTIDCNDLILEIKYNQPHDNIVDKVTNYFPFRMSRSSKYVDGITKLGVI